MADPLKGTFGKPFNEAVAAFRLRLGNLVPTAKWDDIWQEQHDRAFMVAGATKADLLADLAAAVDKAIAQGTSLQEFRKDFRRIVEERGWHGWTGEGTKAGEAWRTRVIYRTNMRTAYSAGRWAQLQAAGHRFIIYRHGGSVEPRIIHLGWDGLILDQQNPAHRAFLVTHAPPNGWGCSCYLAGAGTVKEAQRLGGKPLKPFPTDYQKLDPKTGAPVGIDKGWAYAPGASAVDDILALKSKLEALPPEPSIALIQDWVRSTLFSRWFETPAGVFPLVRLPDAAASLIGTETRIASLSAETALKQKRAHPELSVLEYASAQRVIDTATEVIRDGAESLIFIQAEPGNTGHVLIVKATRTGKGLFVTSFRRISSDPGERERVLRQLRRKEKE